MVAKLSKLLIANRGEIACRIIRTARRMGIKTVAVHSATDRNAKHAQDADEAFLINSTAAHEGYLDGRKLIEIALASGAQAIHPGYGFLSENPDFVEAVETAGLIFIGPTAGAIRAMGLKDSAKVTMQAAGVPVVPGYNGEVQDDHFLQAQAVSISFPVLIKAIAGGGGKGMRKVETENGFSDALASCRSEAKTAFGDDRVLIEKFVKTPRHIEVQIFGDEHGNVVHLFERDCSSQRRHQKIIEEAPAPLMPDAFRDAITEAAKKAALSIGYENAGTVEFIADATSGLQPDAFWFMEMNTRLQVEHPVTELISGVDLVEWQIRVARGEPLPLKQSELHIGGHAVEARLYAEDPSKGFLPATGNLAVVEFPSNIRVDSGVGTGDEITAFYDPMIAKLVATGASRNEAIRALRRGLEQTLVAGVKTNRDFLMHLLSNDAFLSGNVETGLIERNIESLKKPFPVHPVHFVVAALLVARFRKTGESVNPFDLIGSFDLWNERTEFFDLECSDQLATVSLSHKQENHVCAKVGMDTVIIDDYTLKDDRIAIVFEGKQKTYSFTVLNDAFIIRDDAAASFIKPAAAFEIPDVSADCGHRIVAPMHGFISRVHVVTGQKVAKGAALIGVESMKMEHTLAAPADAVISQVLVAKGEQVSEGAPLIEFEKK